MKKLLIIMLFILANTLTFSQDEKSLNYSSELFIINKNVFLRESESINSKKIRVLNFLENVSLIKRNSNKSIFISTNKDERGWIDEDKTTVIPKNWKKIDKFENLNLYIPPLKNLSLKEGKWGKHRFGDKIIESKEDKIFSKNFFIMIHISNETLEERIEQVKDNDAFMNKKSVFDEKYFRGEKLLFKNNLGLDSTQEYLIIFPYNEKFVISVFISLDEPAPSQEEIRTALKILFSFERK